MDQTRILLLEDDNDTRWALATVLRRDGYQVTEAADGELGLRFLSRGTFDLLISDVCMPGLGGFGVFAALRFGEGDQYGEHRDMPVMLTSGRVTSQELARALDAGVDEFIEKPVDPDEFKARVRAVLRRAQAVAAPSARTSGDLADFGMAALAQALHLAGRSARLKVVSGKLSALLDFHLGEIVHAVHERPGHERRGDLAAVEALAIAEGTFEIKAIPESGPRTVTRDTPSLILRSATHADEALAG